MQQQRMRMEDGEMAYREALREAADRLRALLPEDRRGVRVFEDEARRLTTQPGHTPALAAALRGFELAVNAYWLHAEGTGMSQKMAAGFLRRNRRANFRDVDDLSADATMLMRHMCILHAVSDTRAPLWVFSYQRVRNGLAEALAQETGVPIEPTTTGKREAAYHGAVRRDTVAEDNGGLYPSPEDELIAAEEETGVSVWGHLRPSVWGQRS